ncbi:TPA: hypothetical protein ACWS6R_000093 [Klebsiella pneumoniae]|uniref:hypothetical protein n=1 Tax=Klebsiella sp. GG_Kp140 TaxID=3153451 RepID=UPI0032B34425|nr:hypothetical protein [Klebsiella pneumoniae]
MLRRNSLIAAVVLLAGCSIESAMADSEATQPLPALVARAQGSEAGLQAELRGQLHVDEKDCLRVDKRFVIWPHESRLARADDGRLHVSASGKTATVGADVVALSGGHSDSAPAGAEGLTQPIPAQCSGPYFMAFVLTEAAPLKRQ